ncbi:MAG: hypothetical protein MZV64_35205 [Ignavibacteriales bacterium]|nr:hypothetical protein [Ignavibacteriales bacterium]
MERLPDLARLPRAVGAAGRGAAAGRRLRALLSDHVARAGHAPRARRLPRHRDPLRLRQRGNPLARPFSGLSGDGHRFARQLQRSWLAFARTGNPGHDRLPTWPRYRPDERATMVLGRECKLADAPLDAERALLTRWGVRRGVAGRSAPTRLEPAAYLQPITS